MAAAAHYGERLAPGARDPAPYAATAIPSRGRLHRENSCPMRSDVQRDRDRILHSTAFRRLTHKTQMFVYHEGDHYRTRLTHTLEVSQIARTIARQLRLDEDLAEAIALAHDLGHPPFGHAGERAIDRAVEEWGGFDHNVQSFRHVTALERPYLSYDGLNLSWETLEGLVKHNGPPAARRSRGDRAMMHALSSFDLALPLDLARWPSAEAQVAALADDVAWHTHDIDDGMRGGLITLGQVAEVPLVATLLAGIGPVGGAGDDRRRIYAVTRELITRLVADVVSSSRAELANLAPDSPDAVRGAGRSVISFSGGMRERLAELRAFLFASQYEHPRVVRVMNAAEEIVTALIGRYLSDPNALPEEWRRARDRRATRRKQIRVVVDFVAGMTDRYALAEHRRLFDATPELR